MMMDSVPRFSRYKIESKLSKGGMGAIYVARHIELERKVALKVPFMMSSPELVERFVREGKMLAKLDHPNIVRVYDAGNENGHAFIAMALIEGQPLDDYLLENLPSVSQTLRWALSLSDALAHIHDQQIFHRDIKTANIIINSKGNPILVDFGISLDNRETRLTLSEGQFIGTLRYASPESLNGDLQEGRSDIYSLGLVLYECLSGAFPFISEDVKSFIVEVMNGAMVPLEERRPDLPRWLTKIVATCLQINPDDRYQTAQALKQALKAGITSNKSAEPTSETELADDLFGKVEEGVPELEPFDSALESSSLGYTDEATIDKSQGGHDDVENQLEDITDTDVKGEEEADILVMEGQSIAVKEVPGIQKRPGRAIGALTKNLIIAGLFVVASIWLIFFALKSIERSDSGAATLQGLPPIIQQLAETELVQMEQALRNLRQQGKVVFDQESSVFEDPGNCYIIVYNHAGMVALLSPIGADGQRTDVLTDTVLTESIEAVYGPDYGALFVLLL